MLEPVPISKSDTKLDSDSNSEIVYILEEEIDIKYDHLALNRIGHGGFADVFHIFYKDKDAIIKQPRTNEFHSEEVMFHEARVMNQLRHENICEFIGVCTNKLYRGIVLEYCAGQTLDLLLKNIHEKRITVDTVTLLCWCKQIAVGMEYISKTHIHGDLKPENVLIKQKVCCCTKPKFKMEQYREKTYEICSLCHSVNLDNITLKICDFGYSFKKGEKPPVRYGTVQYMAGEVNRSEAHTEKSDVYSFGVVMFSMVLGTPFPNVDATQIAILKLRNEAELDTTSCSSNSIEEIIHQCTGNDPDSRPTFHDVVVKLRSRISKYMSMHSDKDRKEANLERKNFVKHYVNLDCCFDIAELGKKFRDPLTARGSWTSSLDATIRIKLSKKRDERMSSQSTQETEISILDDSLCYDNEVLEDGDGYLKPSHISSPRSSASCSEPARSSDSELIALPISTRKPHEKNLFLKSLNMMKVKVHKMIS